MLAAATTRPGAGYSDDARRSKSQRARFAVFWGAPPLLWQVLFFVTPLGFLVAMTFWSVRSFRLSPDSTAANWIYILNSSVFQQAYLYTFTISLIAAVLASIAAFPAAYAMTFKCGPAVRRLLIFMLIVPFFTSYPVRIYSMQIFFSPRGVINGALGALGLDPIVVLNTSTGTIVGYLTLVLPLVVLLQTLALVNVDKRLIEAAHNLGCGPLNTIVTVILPSARVGLILAGTLAFVLAFGDYVSPQFLGGSKPPTLSIVITDQVKSGNHWPRASVVAVFMVVTLMVAMSAMLGLAYGRRKSS